MRVDLEIFSALLSSPPSNNLNDWNHLNMSRFSPPPFGAFVARLNTMNCQIYRPFKDTSSDLVKMLRWIWSPELESLSIITYSVADWLSGWLRRRRWLTAFNKVAYFTLELLDKRFRSMEWMDVVASLVSQSSSNLTPFGHSLVVRL